jgi:hypothetical protein
LLEELPGNTPQGVSRHDDMPVRRIVDQLNRFGSDSASSRYGQDERGYNAKHSRHLTSRWNAARKLLSILISKAVSKSLKVLKILHVIT